MSRCFAVKRLSASDLTLFQWHYENRNAGNQKAINLNADVFAQQLFPGLDAGSYKVGLTLIGPANQPPLTMTRKIIKNPAYKNWRLDGETIDKDQERFSVLCPGDFALIVFEGDRKPEDLKVVFFALGLDQDRAAHKAFDRLFEADGRKTMLALDTLDLQAIATEGELSADHSLRGLLIDEDLIDATTGSADALQRFVYRVGRNTRIDKQTLQKARAQGEAIGELGESLVELYLSECVQTGQFSSYEWLSQRNAISPMDFEATAPDGVVESIEVKSTSGEFKRAFHVSLAELREAVAGNRPYRIYRVYDASAEGAKLRISQDFTPLSLRILKAFAPLPQGVSPDSVSVSPEVLSFGNVINLAPGE